MKNIVSAIFIALACACSTPQKQEINEPESNEVWVEEILEIEEKEQELDTKATETLSEIDSLLNSI